MSRSFDPIVYVTQVGQELVAAFEIAGFATTPGQIGSAREVPVRKMLMQLLPRGVGVGSGCVIDSYGKTSRQMDVVLYEREICPVFAINDDPASTYYPCEGVIAVGEVKTSVDSRELKDIFKKIKSVKELRRFARLSPGGKSGIEDYVAFRKYGSPLSAVTPKPGDFNQDMHPSDQIYGFALGGRLDLSIKTLCETFANLSLATGYGLSPNLLVTLDGSILCPVSISPDRQNASITVSPQDANSIYSVRHSNKSFPFLLSRLQAAYTSGRTVAVDSFDRYIVKDGVQTLPSGGIETPLPSSLHMSPSPRIGDAEGRDAEAGGVID